MIRKLAPYTKGYRVWIFLGVLCSAGEAVLELLLPKAMSQIVDVGIANGDKAYILAMGLKMILMALASLVMGVGAAALAARAGMGFGANVRAAEYAQVQRFSFANIERFSTASLITRLTNDVSSVQMTLMMGMRMLVRAPVMLITALVMALTISLQLSQVFLVVLPLLLLLVAIVIRYVGPFFTALQKSTDDLNLVVQENLNAIRVVKSFVREDREQEKFTQRSETLRQTAERAYSFVVLFVPLVTLIMGGTIVSIMWLGGHYVAGGQMLSGDLLAFFTYASEILMALMMVAMVMMVLTRSIACGKRIVEVLEQKGQGLNLTWEVRNGILNHRTSGHPATLEGNVVRLSDKIAYINHDIDDAIRGKIMKEEDLPREYTDILGNSVHERLNIMIHDIIEHSQDKPEVAMSPEREEAMHGLRRWMFDHVYHDGIAKAEEGRAQQMIEMLYGYYMAHPEELPEESHRIMEIRNETKERAVCDYIAGMTDIYAIDRFKELFIPKAWSV